MRHAVVARQPWPLVAPEVGHSRESSSWFRSPSCNVALSLYAADAARVTNASHAVKRRYVPVNAALTAMERIGTLCPNATGPERRNNSTQLAGDAKGFGVEGQSRCSVRTLLIAGLHRGTASSPCSGAGKEGTAAEIEVTCTVRPDGNKHGKGLLARGVNG